MSLLSGAAIADAIRETSLKERLVITPLFDLTTQIKRGAASIDLHLGCRFAAAKKRKMAEATAGYRQMSMDNHYVSFGSEFVLHPSHFVLATTLEWVRLPPCLGAYVIGRSSLARMGLIIETAAGVHPSYSGVITLELTNVGEIPLRILPGQAICQLFLHTIKNPAPIGLDRSAFLGSLHPHATPPKPDDVEKFLRTLDNQEEAEHCA